MKTKKPITRTITNILLAFAVFFIYSCEADDIIDVEQEYCASCVEANSGYAPEDFCGSESSVDYYIRELENTSGQRWSCTKY